MIGNVINNYEIRALIGHGGMGSVYLAVHALLERTAAVKVLRRVFEDDEAMVSRFMNEARAASAIEHPNIIQVLDVGRLEARTPYILMEYLEGETLGQRLRRRGRFTVAEMLAIVEPMAAALGAAHAKGVVHRDLKPENVFLVRDAGGGGGERVKVLDFGIAKLRGDRSRHWVDTDGAGAVMGTPVYMSPEQCRGGVADVDGRSDIYALGTLMYEMLCGRPPFDGARGYGEVLVMHLLEPPLPPRSHCPTIPAAVEGVILRALAKERDDRFATMEELAICLREAAEAPVPPLLTLVPPVAAAGAAEESEEVIPDPPAAAASSSDESNAAGEEAGATFTALVAPPTVVLRRGQRRMWIPATIAALAAIAALALWQRQGTEVIAPAAPPEARVGAAGPAPAPPAPAPATATVTATTVRPSPPAPSPAPKPDVTPKRAATPVRSRGRSRKTTVAPRSLPERAAPARAPAPARRIQRW